MDSKIQIHDVIIPILRPNDILCPTLSGLKKEEVLSLNIGDFKKHKMEGLGFRGGSDALYTSVVVHTNNHFRAIPPFPFKII